MASPADCCLSAFHLLENTEVRNTYEGETSSGEVRVRLHLMSPFHMWILCAEAAIGHHLESQDLGPVQTTLKYLLVNLRFYRHFSIYFCFQPGLVLPLILLRGLRKFVFLICCQTKRCDRKQLLRHEWKHASLIYLAFCLWFYQPNNVRWNRTRWYMDNAGLVLERCSVRIETGTLAALIDIFRGFLQSLQQMLGISMLPISRPRAFRSKPFPIYLLSSYHLTLYSRLLAVS